jgi:anti-anti-sigma factor
VTVRDGGLRVARPGKFALELVRDRGPGLAADQELTIDIRWEPAYVLVTVAGELDIATARGLQERLSALTAAGLAVVADLDQVSFIDAAGLGALARVARHARTHGSSLHVVCSRPRTRQLFQLTEVDDRVPLASTRAEALQMLVASRGRPEAAASSR